MEELLSDVEPPRDEIFSDLSRGIGRRTPLFRRCSVPAKAIWASSRLLKALRHEVPDVDVAAARLKLPRRRYARTSAEKPITPVTAESCRLGV